MLVTNVPFGKREITKNKWYWRTVVPDHILDKICVRIGQKSRQTASGIKSQDKPQLGQKSRKLLLWDSWGQIASLGQLGPNCFWNSQDQTASGIEGTRLPGKKLTGWAHEGYGECQRRTWQWDKLIWGS